MVEDFEKSDADNNITFIGAKEWLTLLKPINEKFDTLHSHRTLEQSEKEAGQTKEAMAFVKGEEKYKSLANAINEEVKNALKERK